MKTTQLHYVNQQWVAASSADFNFEQAQLALAFGSRELVQRADIYQHIQQQFPQANVVLASTSGEIIGTEVYDDTVVVTGVYFEKTIVRSFQKNITDFTDSFSVGEILMQELNAFPEKLATVFVLSDGTLINGSELVSGFNKNNPNEVPINGGLAGDGANFAQTATGLNQIAGQGNVIAIGFYGNDIQSGHGSFGGWDEFGKERTITKSDKNVLYEIDGKNALDLYKEYLGPYADELPGSALLFPLSIKIEGVEKKLVRTILSLDESNKSMTFAGNLPVGSKVRLMKANFEKLIEASSVAAAYTLAQGNDNKTQLAILVSCVGRKLILQERTFEEVAAAENVIGTQSCITGFYSYGEISPFNPGINCELHNQTMTITTFSE